MKPAQLIALFAIPLAACGSPDAKSKSVSSKNEPFQNAVMQDEPADESNNGASSNNGTSTNNGTSSDTNNGTSGETNNAPQPVCGDGVVEGTEACDGSVASTCEAFGFDAGSIGCSDTCEIDTSQCIRATCGDGVVQAAETCDDGSDNGEYDACDANCSGLGPHCGDGLLNGAELCDANDLGAATCADFGFDGGTIGCATGCDYDTSKCTTCGDGIVSGAEVCDDGGMNGTYGNCNALCSGIGAFCGDGIKNGNEACDGADIAAATCGSLGSGHGTPTCTSACDFNTSVCSLAPAVGEIVISEIMQNPAADLDNDGEFFEVWNATSQPRDLGGCMVESSTASGPESFTINGSLEIAPGDFAVFARNSSAPFVADYTYNGAINLNNSVDELALICPQPVGGMAEIDRVSYDDGVSFPDPDGASMSLAPGRMDSSLNDQGLSWCEASSTFGNGDRGTPGGANDACP